MSIATRIQSMEEHIADAYDSLSKFGVAAPSNKNIENIASLVNEIYDNTPKTDYVSGTNLTLENTRVGKIDFKDSDGIEKIGLGATNQYTTTGKNKLPYPYFQGTKTTGGITYTDLGDGRIKIDGTATAYSHINLIGTDKAQIDIPGNYIYGGVNENVGVQVTHNEDETYTVLGRSNGSSAQINKTTYTTGYVELFVKSGATVNNIIITPMITEAQDNNYEPYTGGKAGPNPDFPQDINVICGDQTLNIYNKNLLPNNARTRVINGVTFTKNTDGSILVNGTANRNTQYDILLPTANVYINAGDYYLSGCPSGGTSSTYRLVIGVDDTLYGEYGTGRAVTLSSGILKAYIFIANGTTVTNLLYKPQLELGNSATSFTPPDNYEINLPVENLLNLTAVPTNTTRDVTLTNLGGNKFQITANGNRTQNWLYNYPMTIPQSWLGKTLTLSVTKISGSTSIKRRNKCWF